MNIYMSIKNPTLLLHRKEQGFTLIELLIVIAILGVLAAALLVAIDPVEQLARGRDSGRKSTINQLGRAIEQYYTISGSYPPESGSAWANSLKNAGEIKIIPQNPIYANGAPECVGWVFQGYCYDVDPVGSSSYVVTGARAESKSEAAKIGCTGAGQVTWILWSSPDGRTGVYCGNSTFPNADAGPFGSNLK